MLNKEDIKNILNLISLAPISGKDAIVVAVLQVKLERLLGPEVAKDEKDTPKDAPVKPEKGGKKGPDKKAEKPK